MRRRIAETKARVSQRIVTTKAWMSQLISMVEALPAGRLLKKIALCLLGVWALWLAGAIVASCFGFAEKAGQIGDTFGAINALFTSFALLGVVLTTYMQRKELESQGQDAEENRKSLQRERREQFLAARLSGTVALLQASEVSQNSMNQKSQILKRLAAKRVLGLQQQIGFLLCEARLGFEQDWSLQVEERAASDYLIDILLDLRGFLEEIAGQADEGHERIVIWQYIQDNIYAIHVQIADRHPGLAKRLKQHNSKIVLASFNSPSQDAIKAIDEVVGELRQSNPTVSDLSPRLHPQVQLTGVHAL